MKPSEFSTSACRHCRYYTPEGRRGGQCQQLNVPVQSTWKACSLAIPPFTPAWESVEDLIVWQQKTVAMAESAIADALNTEALANDDRVSHPQRTAELAFPVDTIAPSERARKISALWM